MNQNHELAKKIASKLFNHGLCTTPFTFQSYDDAVYWIEQELDNVPALNCYSDERWHNALP